MKQEIGGVLVDAVGAGRPQLGAAFAASRGAHFAVPPEEAAAMLAASGEDDDMPDMWYEVNPDAEDTPGPISFAVDLDSTDLGFSGGFTNGAAPEWADYKQALDRVIALAPELLDPEHPVSLHGNGSRRCDHPVALLDELVVAMGNAMHRAGVVKGAAYEHLRLAMVAPRKVCRCNGHGCEACGGRGTVAAERPVLTMERPPQSARGQFLVAD